MEACDSGRGWCFIPRSTFIKSNDTDPSSDAAFDTSVTTAANARNKFTDIQRLSPEHIIFFMSLVKDPFITVKFSQ